MGQIVGGAAKPKRCNLNKLSQLETPAAGEHILVSSDNSMNAAGQGNFDCYIVGDGTTAATALPLIKTYANDVDDEPTAGSDNLVKSGGVKRSLDTKLDNNVRTKVFYVTDSNGNIIAKVDEDGVHSVDFKIGANAVSVSVALGNVATQISEAVNVEKALREAADEAEKERAKAVEATKLDTTLSGNTFYFTDPNGYVIAKIDSDGVSGIDFKIKKNGVLVSLGGMIASEEERAVEEENKKLNKVLNEDKIIITDSQGYIIARIDEHGIHSAQDKHAVACMVLSENYYPIAAPTRDSQGNVTHANVMFATGVEGEIDITYSNGVSTSIGIRYGDYTYTITISRDNDGNVTTVSVN